MEYKELWIVYYWLKIAREDTESRPYIDCIELYDNPDNDGLRKEIEKREGSFDADNSEMKTGVICKIAVERVKYKDDPFESLELKVYKKDDTFLGIVTTNIISLHKDINNVALLGSGIVQKNCTKITTLIEQNFYSLETRYADNQKKPAVIGSFNVLAGIYSEYKETVKNIPKNTDNAAEDTGSIPENIGWKGYGIDTSNGEELFYIPVGDFKEIYESMDISKEMKITEYKKFLNRHEYSKVNYGRTDYTHSKFGKVIALYIKKIKEAAEK